MYILKALADFDNMSVRTTLLALYFYCVAMIPTLRSAMPKSTPVDNTWNTGIAAFDQVTMIR